jgi:hypothetical protein
MHVRSEEEWRNLLAEYRSSKESASTFCKHHKIHTSTLYYQLAKVAGKPKDSLTMLPVVNPLVKAIDSIDSVELVMPKGMSLRFSKGASAGYVAAIIKALG